MPSALDDPATRDALAALRGSALRWLIAGTGALLLGVLLWGTVVVPGGGLSRGLSASGFVVLVLVTLGSVVGVAGGGALLRTRRWARELPRTEWQDGRLLVTGPGSVAFHPAVPDADAQPVRLRLLSTAVWRTQAVQRLHGHEVRAAPVGGAEWVLTADGSRTLYGARAGASRT